MTDTERLLDYLAPLVGVGRELMEQGRSEAQGLAEGNTRLVTVPRNTIMRLGTALLLPPDIEAAVDRRLRR